MKTFNVAIIEFCSSQIFAADRDFGRPAATAVTPLCEVCVAVFAVTRGMDDGPAAARVDLRLPAPFAALS